MLVCVANVSRKCGDAFLVITLPSHCWMYSVVTRNWTVSRRQFLLRQGGERVVRTYYVTPSGRPTNDGASFAAAMDYATAFAAVNPGERVLLQAGTYAIPFTAGAKNTVTFAKVGTASSPIRIEVEDNGRAVLDFGCPEKTYVQDGYGLLVSGDYHSFRGLDITRASYQGVFVTGDHKHLRELHIPR